MSKITWHIPGLNNPDDLQWPMTEMPGIAIVNPNAVVRVFREPERPVGWIPLYDTTPEISYAARTIYDSAEAISGLTIRSTPTGKSISEFFRMWQELAGTDRT